MCSQLGLPPARLAHRPNAVLGFGVFVGLGVWGLVLFFRAGRGEGYGLGFRVLVSGLIIFSKVP